MTPSTKSDIFYRLYNAFIAIGTRQANLLADISQEAHTGAAQFDEQPNTTASWKKMSWNAVPNYSEGQEVDVYQTKEEAPWYLVAARPRTNLSTKERYLGFNVYLRSPVLCERLTAAIRAGELSQLQVQAAIQPELQQTHGMCSL